MKNTIKLLLALCFSLFTAHLAFSQSYNIYTAAGNGTGGFSGDGGPSTSAEINVPVDVCTDDSGNFYIADQANNRIRKVNKNGIISTFAGNGISGDSGDGGSAIAAEIVPFSICADDSGNLYVACYPNCIREINSKGIIRNFAGNSIQGFSGDGGPATAAEFNGGGRIAADDSGNIYIADIDNQRIRKVNKKGIISTIAGNGYTWVDFVGMTEGKDSGDGGPATAAELDDPYGVAVDDSGNVYIAEFYGFTVRKVNRKGIISTIAGTGARTYTKNYNVIGSCSGDGGPATAADFGYLQGVAVDDSGNIYIDDWGCGVIRKINRAGIINTIAGGGSANPGDGGPATAALINPEDMALGDSGKIYIASDYQRIRKLVISLTGINEISQQNVILLYPNPSSNGIFSVVINNYQLIINNVVEVYNELGQRIYDEALRPTSSRGGQAQGDNKIDLSSQPSGIYLYRVITEKGELVGSGKLIIE